MNSLIDTENFAINIANMAFADLTQKKKIKEAIMKEIALCCVRYSKVPRFKEDMDKFIEYQKMKDNYDR